MCIYSGYKYYIRCMICKYFHYVGYIFIVLTMSFFWRDEVQLTNFLYRMCFKLFYRCSLFLTVHTKDILLCFLVLDLTWVNFCIQYKEKIEVGEWCFSGFLLICMWTPNYSIISGKDCSFSTALPLRLCLK